MSADSTLKIAGAILLLAIAAAIFVPVVIRLVKAFDLSEFMAVLLKCWQYFVSELKGERDKAGLINGFAVIAVTILILLAILIERVPSVIAQVLGRDLSTDADPPYATIGLIACLPIIFLFSIWTLTGNSSERDLHERAGKFRDFPPIIHR